MRVSGEWYVFSKKSSYLINIDFVNMVLIIWFSTDGIKVFTGSGHTWLNKIPASILIQRARL